MTKMNLHAFALHGLNWNLRARFMFFQWGAIATCLLAQTVLAMNDASAKEPELSFNRDVRPILSDRCFHCHGPDADNQDSSFRLDSFENATADLGDYAGVVPGNLDASELHARIRSDDDDQMPPAASVRKLTDAEKDVLDAWIKSGARYDSHWSLNPIAERTQIPETNDGWARNNIDRFVADRMKAKGLRPNEFASREKWLRRVTFDLTGLPPSLEEIDSFLSDKTDQSYGRVVDRLLSSEACAERLASEWLDVARYSDSYGYQRDDERYVWPYRDWVIRAFSDNMPYDQFVTWQLAGDLMESPTTDQIIATTFNRLHSHKKEGGVALEEFRVENVADRTHTFAAAFMGLTMECARCHDHKYDPIKTKEYYQLSSFFANIDERGLISYFTDAVPTPAASLPTEEQAKALENAEASLREVEQQYARSVEDAKERYASWREDPTAIDGTAARLPGLVAKLEFESTVPVPVELLKDEREKDAKPDALVGLLNVASVAGAGKVAIAVAGSANRLIDGEHGKAIELTGDDSVVLPGIGHFARHQPFSISIRINPSELDERAVIYRRSRGWDDAGSVGYELVKLGGRLSAKLVHFWPGNAIAIETDDVLEKDQWHHVVVTYDGSSRASGLRIYLNGAPAKTRVVQDRLTRTISDWREGYFDLAIGARYRDRGFKGGKVDDFLVFERELSAIESLHLFDGDALDSLYQSNSSLEDRTDTQTAAFRDYYVSAIDLQARVARFQLQAAREKWNEVMDGIPAMTVMREQAKPRPAYVLTRGAYDQRGEQVTADTPAFLPSFPANAPRNRLGLARWITSPDHPLMSRVTVNRYWQMVFGDGLVRTPEDFGVQGEVPSHPELLDWLSRDFIENGWDLRRLLRMMVLSSTYRQSAVVDKAARDRDPENRLLARSKDVRLSAEMIRDNALAVSGLLNRQVGGAPVKPYDVALAYTPLPVDEGKALYRRSLYTFWKRTSPAPVMMAMNASKREVCRLRRDITHSPLQALVLLNGPQFVEASRVLGAELLEKHSGNVEGLVVEAFRRLTSRQPSAQTTEILTRLYEEQLQSFTGAPEDAAELTKVGDAATDDGVDVKKLAAATVLVNSIMNLDECVRHQ